MGYFTWTDAAITPIWSERKMGYTRRSIIGYGGFAKVICPNDTEIKENHYDGYGMFGGYDIYDLVVDWNKADLLNIFDRMESGHFGRILRPYAHMFVNGVSDDKITEAVKRYGVSIPASDWKRNIGIAIACNDEDNKSLRYPIKITSRHKKYKYSELGVSLSTQ